MKTLVAMPVWQPQGSIDLQWKNACHHHNSFSFDQMFLKLADKVDMDEILNKFENWPEWIIIILELHTLIAKKGSV